MGVLQVAEGEEIPSGEQRVLLVSNIPPNLSNPDGLFYAFERFGTVERIKAGLASIPKLCATDG